MAVLIAGDLIRYSILCPTHRIKEKARILWTPSVPPVPHLKSPQSVLSLPLVTMPPFNKYHYEPLRMQEAFRLIVIEPATDQDAPLCCSIVQAMRSKTVADYYVISYAWEKREFSRSLEIQCGDDSS